MKVKLISMTKPVSEDIQELSPEELTAYVARVSNPSNQMNNETAPKLLGYCIKNAHWSVFEHVSFTVEIKTSRAIAAQILRHRSAVFQEFCLSGDTEVYFDTLSAVNNKKRKLFKKTLKELYDISRDKSHVENIRIRYYDLDKMKFTHSKIKEVFYTGKKPIFELTLQDDKKIKTTKEHKFFDFELAKFLPLETIVGLSRIDGITSMSRRPLIATFRGSKCVWVIVKSIEYLGVEDTYDIEVEGSSHNYIANGILVHNSQRYALALENEFYPARRQDSKNRQNSIDDMSDEDKQWFEDAQQEVWNRAKALYTEAISRGIAKEQARFLLPLSTQTTLYMTNNIRNWLHYIDLRTSNGTQLEHKLIADAIKGIFVEQFPAIAKAKGWLDDI